jgi:hypothetical protein
MFIAPLSRLSPQDLTPNSRLGASEAARQEALLRLPGHDAPARPEVSPITQRFHQSIRREGWKDGGY